MLRNKPYITVLTSTFNSAPSLQACVDSVNSQTFDGVEHVIIDNCSTDGTVEIIKHNETAGRLSWWLSENDNGIYNAWNKALPECSGDWIIFLGSDDTLNSPTVIEEVVEKLKTLPPERMVAYGKAMVHRTDGGVSPLYWRPVAKSQGDAAERVYAPTCSNISS